VETALETPFAVTSVSYAGTFGLGADARLELQRVACAFGLAGSRHSLLENGGEIEIIESSVVDSGRRNHAQLNFLVAKLRVSFPETLSANITVKLYQHNYFQIFGLSDGAAGAAEVVAQRVLHFVASRIMTTGPLVSVPAALDILALSAFHDGVMKAGYSFDNSSLEAAFAQEGLTASRNPRNGCLVVRLGTKQGSILFHSTGNLQLMGLRHHPDAVRLKIMDILRRNTNCLVPILTPPRKKRTRKDAPKTSKRSRVVTPMPSPPTDNATATTATSPSSKEENDRALTELTTLFDLEPFAQSNIAPESADIDGASAFGFPGLEELLQESPLDELASSLGLTETTLTWM